MVEADRVKTTFVTDNCIYFYTRISFRLKIAGTEFQEFMNKAFEGLIEKTIEVYVEEIIVKSNDKGTAAV